MPYPVDTLELAMRLRRDANETSMPEYAALLRRAADELEAFVKSHKPAQFHAERKAG